MAISPDREVACPADARWHATMGKMFFFGLLAVIAIVSVQHQVWTHYWIFGLEIAEAIAIICFAQMLGVARRSKSVY